MGSSAARFITLEGIDGAGKSSQVEALAQRLGRDGIDVVLTREPGGTPLAEQLRATVLGQGMDVLTEALLVFAARRDHLVKVIEPALSRGATVLCDRFTDASFAYQGGGGGLALPVLQSLELWVQGERQPDLTFLFDLPVAAAAQRRAQVRPADRFEQQERAFFERVRAAYLARLAAQPARFALIDASRTPAEVWQSIDSALAARAW